MPGEYGYVTWLEGQLKRFTYKPGWSMKIVPPLYEFDEPYLQTKFVTEDTHNPGRQINIGARDRIPDFFMRSMDEEKFADWLLRTLFRIERHETQEWLKRDGAIYKDPHKEEM